MGAIHDSTERGVHAEVMNIDDDHPDPEVAPKATRRRFAPEYKARILAEYERLPDGEKGALLRREGLYSSLLSEWRKQAAAGAVEGLAKKRGRPGPDAKDRQIARLREFQERNKDQAEHWIDELKAASVANRNIFAVLMEAARYCSLGQLTRTFFEVGGIEPWIGHQSFMIENGLITQYTGAYRYQGVMVFDRALQIEYSDWLEDTYPEEHGGLFEDQLMLVFTEENRERHRQLINEWAGELGF